LWYASILTPDKSEIAVAFPFLCSSEVYSSGFSCDRLLIILKGNIYVSI
jgi:hypothetical protein